MRTHTHAHTYTYVHTHTHTCTHTHAHTYTYIHTHAHTHAHIHTCTHIHTHTHPCSHMHTHKHTHPVCNHQTLSTHTHFSVSTLPFASHYRIYFFAIFFSFILSFCLGFERGVWVVWSKLWRCSQVKLEVTLILSLIEATWQLQLDLIPIITVFNYFNHHMLAILMHAFLHFHFWSLECLKCLSGHHGRLHGGHVSIGSTVAGVI